MPEAVNPIGQWLDAGLGTAMEAGLHHLLATDDASLRRLAALEGKQLLLQLEAPAVLVVLRPHGEGIGFAGHLDGDADTQVRATLSGILRLLTGPGEMAGEGVEISGDTALASTLREILRELDIDWEGLLGDHVGDLAAHSLAQMLRAGQRFLSQSSDSLVQDLDNFLHEELAVVPARPQLEQYSQRVDELRLAADRLQARVAQLEVRSANRTDVGS